MRITSLAFGALLSALFGCSAYGQDCNPAAFTWADVERLSFSDSLAISAIDVMETSTDSDKKQNFGLGVVVEGVPIQATWDEAKSVATYMKRNSSLNISRNTEIDVFRSNLSLVGERMFAECLKRRTANFTIEVPEFAYTEDDFLVTIKWHPTYSLKDREPVAPVRVRVINGTADGAKLAEATIADENSVDFEIHRTDRTKTLQIVPLVDGMDLGEDRAVTIPPIVDLRFTSRLREGPDPSQPFTALCSDDGGGNCGSDEHPDSRCIYAENGLFIPSTAVVELQGIKPKTFPVGVEDPAKVKPYELDVGTDHMCVRYSTWGVSRFGKKGYSAIQSLRFSIREVIPLTDPS